MIGVCIKRISVLNLYHVLKPFVKSTPGVAKTQDFRNALDKVIVLPRGLWVILIWALSEDPLTGLRTRLAWRVDPVGSLFPAAFGHDVCLMSGSLS